MANIIKPLDNIIQVVNDLIKTSHTGRRGSSLDNAFDSIIENVNIAKNNIITHLIDNADVTKGNIEEVHKISNVPIHSDITYSSALKNKPATNNIIIPLGEKKPDNSVVNDVENRVHNILKEVKSSATIIKTSTTDKGNYVINFKTDDNIDQIKEDFIPHFGDKVKVVKAIQPKIKIVGIPMQFDTSDKENVVQYISETNDTIKNELNVDKECLKFLFAYNVNNCKSIVLRCSPKLRHLLKNSGDKVIISHKLCKLYDRHHVLQCANCCGFGHSTNNCKKDSSQCTFCAGNHSYKNCTNKNNKEAHQCFNCATSDSYKSHCNTHNSFSDKCPIKITLRNKIISRTSTINETFT